jgi:integrase
MLSAKKVERLKAPGKYFDGHGLYFRIRNANNRGFMFRYERDGRERWLGLGASHTTTLKEARALAREARRLLRDGIDPIDQRKERRAARAAAAVKRTTFGECVDTFLAFKRPEWKNAKHAKQWEMCLRVYAKPLHTISPADIDLAMVAKTLEPIWNKIPETASRTRQRIEAVLDHWSAKNEIHGYSNPAAWERLKHVLASPSKLKEAKGNGHWPALPYERVPEFMHDLRAREGIAARALEFLILTSTRTGDLIGQERERKPPMKWAHVDLGKRVWTIPSTKTGKEHRVPLSDAAIAVLREMQQYGSDPDGIVFPGAQPGKPLSNASMGAVIERMNAGRVAPNRYTDPKENNRDVVPHGFRSSVMDWAHERTNFAKAVVDKMLAHVVDDKVEAAYRRRDLYKKREQLAAAWARFCSSPPVASAQEPGTVVRIGGRA